MKRTLSFMILALALSSCYKSELDVAQLNTNPFDPDYQGANVFVFDSIYNEDVNGTFRQVFQFSVNSHLFLEPTSYQVLVVDLNNSSTMRLGQFPLGSDVFKYIRDTIATGQICLELRLSNELSEGRPETLCGTP